MLSPEHLRVLVRRHLTEARRERTPFLRRRLASHALALAQLAEKIERRNPRSSPFPVDPAAVVRRVLSVLLLAPLPSLLDIATGFSSL